MNTDIRLSVGFWQHPKTYRLEKRIGMRGIRSLQILWCWCAQNRPDGNLGDLDGGEIEFVADWRGRKGAFVEACLACGWLDETGEGFCLHEWADYNPYQAAAGSREQARRERARNAAHARWGRESDPVASDAAGNAKGCSSNAQAYAQNDASICSGDAPSNAQKMPSLTSTSTKEIKESSLRSDSCAEQSGDGSTPDLSPAEVPFICLPLNNGKTHQVMPGDVAHYRELYPAVDVEQELRNMLGWMEANPRKRKTRTGIRACISRWLAGKQDRGPGAMLQAMPPAAPTEYQKRQQERRIMARMLLESDARQEAGYGQARVAAAVGQGEHGLSGRVLS